MTKRLELTLDNGTFQKLEKDRIENGFKDRQDVIYQILREKYFVKRSFFGFLKSLFK